MLNKISFVKTVGIGIVLVTLSTQGLAEGTKKYVRKKTDLPMRKYDPNTKKLIEDEHKSNRVTQINDSMSEGEKIFITKGCNLCHDKKSSKLGPSLKKITRYYKSRKKDMTLYFQRKSKPIINPNRGGMMRGQLAKLTILTPEQHFELASYMAGGWKKK